MLNDILVYMTHPHVGAWNFAPRQFDRLQSALPRAKISVCYNSKEFLDRLPTADAVIVWHFKKAWLDSAPNLRLIATPAAGTEWIEPEPSERLKISFGGFHGPMIAESVAGAAFYFCKAFKLSADMQSQRKWARIKISERLSSLYRKQATILGFGKIGREIGRVLKPFGCRIVGVKRTPCPPPPYFGEGDRVAAVESLPEILKTTDHLIFVLPGGPGTSGMFTREHFRLLPPHCIVYNVGRGNVYREADLVEALQSGAVAGAYLDVFETEPLPEGSPLWGMDNVLIQPHLSAASPQYLDLFVEELIGKWHSFD